MGKAATSPSLCRLAWKMFSGFGLQPWVQAWVEALCFLRPLEGKGSVWDCSHTDICFCVLIFLDMPVLLPRASVLACGRSVVAL